MPLYRMQDDAITDVSETTLAHQKVLERADLQRLLAARIDLLVPDGMVLTDEFGAWEDSLRRIDLLCVDKGGGLVVVELKRGTTGSHMELQALRYAAMVSTLTFEQAVEAHGKYLSRLGDDSDAREKLSDFLDCEGEIEERFAHEVRIVLVSEEFGKELTSTVLWLREYEVDITCFRLLSYVVEGAHLINLEQLLPLREAAEYQVRLREKKREVQRSSSQRDYTKYDVTCGGETFAGLAKRQAMWRAVHYLVSSGQASPDEVQAMIPWRAKNLWIHAEGSLNSESIAAAIQRRYSEQGKDWDPARWFTSSDELLHHGGRTWALSNQWGRRTGEALQGLAGRWSGLEVGESDSV